MDAPSLDVPISARSRRQAMDWSLVLASQGIEHRLDHDASTGWTLTVSAADQERALAQIRLYRLENRHWRWRQPVFKPGWFFDWGSTAWLVLVILFYVWSQARAEVRSQGMMTGTALAQGEWWRLITATWLHADLAHLALNAVFGFLFLGLVMGRYGPGVGLLAASLAGVGANWIGGLVHGPDFHGLGASGVVMGALGLLTFPELMRTQWQKAIAYKLIGGSLLAGGLIFVMIGVNPESDVIAHLVGFSFGWLFGLTLALFPRFTRRPWVNLAAGILFTMQVLISWFLALKPR